MMSPGAALEAFHDQFLETNENKTHDGIMLLVQNVWLNKRFASTPIRQVTAVHSEVPF